MPVQPPLSCPGSSAHFQGFPMLTGNKRKEKKKSVLENVATVFYQKLQSEKLFD